MFVLFFIFFVLFAIFLLFDAGFSCCVLCFLLFVLLLLPLLLFAVVYGVALVAAFFVSACTCAFSVSFLLPLLGRQPLNPEKVLLDESGWMKVLFDEKRQVHPNLDDIVPNFEPTLAAFDLQKLSRTI